MGLRQLPGGRTCVFIHHLRVGVTIRYPMLSYTIRTPEDLSLSGMMQIMHTFYSCLVMWMFKVLRHSASSFWISWSMSLNSVIVSNSSLSALSVESNSTSTIGFLLYLYGKKTDDNIQDNVIACSHICTGQKGITF